MELTPEQIKFFTEKFGSEAAAEIKKQVGVAQEAMQNKYEELKKSALTSEDFDKAIEKHKKDVVEPLNVLLKDLEEKSIAQGKRITEMSEKGSTGKKISFNDFLISKLADPKNPDKMNPALRKSTEILEFTTDEMKAAGVTSIGNSIAALNPTPSNPWLPGLDGGTGLEIFEIMQNPNFMINRVDLGSTNQSYLAWINELPIQGTVDTNIAEGGLKPQIQPSWNVAFSTAKKAAAWVEITEELADDVPQLLTRTRRIIEEEVIRAFDNQIQADVIAIAKPYQITDLDGKIAFANRYDAERAMLAQVGINNFVANTIAINPVTGAMIDTEKNENGTYLLPPFLPRLQALTVEANKVAVNYALVGDLKQYKVDIYKAFTLKVGWINDEFIHNKFAILGEMRYHSYISDNRKAAIVYANLDTVVAQITAQP